MTTTNEHYFAITGTAPVSFINSTGWADGTPICLSVTGDATFNHDTASPPENALPLKMIGNASVRLKSGGYACFVKTSTHWLQVS